MNNPDVSIIIVSWNVERALRKNLQHLFSLPIRVAYEVIVVDNGSSDKTAAMVRSFFPGVELIQNDSNRGFAYGCNQGLRISRGNTLFLFNPDMLMGKGVIEHVWSTLKTREDIGVMGVKLVGENGAIIESVRRDPGFLDQTAILLKLPHLFPSMLKRYLAKDFDYGQDAPVEQIRGSFFALRREVLDKIGFLDDKNFFVWFEEVDYCRRVREAGLKVWYCSRVSCTDLVGQSFKQQSVSLKQARFSKSMARYFFKWHGWAHGSVIHLLRPWAILAGAMADFWKIRSRPRT